MKKYNNYPVKYAVLEFKEKGGYTDRMLISLKDLLFLNVMF